MKVLLFTGLGALFFTYYWADNFDPGVRELPELGAPKVFYIAADMASHEVPEHRVQFALDKLGGLDYLVLNHLGAAPAGTWTRSVHRTSWLMQVLRHSSALPPSLQGELPELHATDSLALPSLMDSKGSLVVVSSLPSRVPTSFSNPYSAAKFTLDSFFGSLQRELDVQNVNVAITMCILGLRDHASAAEGVRDVTRVKATLGPKAALVVICGGATRVFHVFCPWRFHMLCLLQTWLPHSKAWFIHQELSVTATAAA
uniref:Hydroxysteroid 11-beta dehydrogenase 1 like n=1 Tax=Molossus molossus TaxID=27622 RepID=A0A7J8I9K4_MOLMO|nr:hypothetical protein HJG59_010643 [Molossus molossus]